MSVSSFRPLPSFSVLPFLRTGGVRSRSADPPVRAAEAAWRILRVCAIGIESRAAGWCVGPLNARELRFVGRSLRRTPPSGRAAQRRAARLGLLHQQSGHDDACRALGIPEGVLRELIEQWSPPGCARFLAEAVFDAVEPIARISHDEGWSRGAAREAVETMLGERISIRGPEAVSESVSKSGWKPGPASVVSRAVSAVSGARAA